MEISKAIDELERKISSQNIDQMGEPGRFIHACLEEALAALKEGNFPVGAVAVKDGQIIESAHNHVFHPYFRSDLHAEMSLLTALEDRLRGDHTEHSGVIVYSSLEPCLMCAARLLNAGVAGVYFGAPDPQGGVLAILDHLPVAWEHMREGTRTKFGQANCSDELKKLCLSVLSPVVDELCSRLEKRS